MDLCLSRRVLHTHIPKEYISIKMTLNNYDSLEAHREHDHIICSYCELVIQDGDACARSCLQPSEGQVEHSITI